MRSSSYGRRYVASPASVCSRHTNPGLRSARALISSSRATKPAMTGSSSVPFILPILTWAMCRTFMRFPLWLSLAPVDCLICLFGDRVVGQARDCRDELFRGLGDEQIGDPGVNDALPVPVWKGKQPLQALVDQPILAGHAEHRDEGLDVRD